MSPRNTHGPIEPNKGLVAIGEWLGLAFLLPCATLIGYLFGSWLDEKLGTKFLFLVFTLLGIAGGLVQIIRQFLKEGRDSDRSG